MKESGDGEIFLIPFHSLADTLQRLIFYKAAILSNKQSILPVSYTHLTQFPNQRGNTPTDGRKTEKRQTGTVP